MSTNTNLPDGRDFARQVDERLSAERKMAARQLADALIAHYLNNVNVKECTTKQLPITVHKLKLSGEAQRYQGQEEVQKLATVLLNQAYWGAEYTSFGSITLNPGEKIVDQMWEYP